MGQIPTLETCDIDFYPVEYNVIICPEEVESKTKGGIILTDAKRETDGLAKSWGLLVSKSPLAFNYDAWPDGYVPPQPGDHVFYARYAGTIIEHNGKEYRVMKDKDVALVRRKPASIANKLNDALGIYDQLKESLTRPSQKESAQ